MLYSFDNCQNKVSADQYCITISQAQVQRSSGSMIYFLKLTADQVLGFGLDSRLKPGCYSGGEGGVHAKANFWPKLSPDTLLTFLQTYSLHKHLLESP